MERTLCEVAPGITESSGASGVQFRMVKTKATHLGLGVIGVVADRSTALSAFACTVG